MMFYTKTIFGNSTITTELADDNIYTRCPKCGIEHSVDLQDILSTGGDLYGTAVYCEACSDKLSRKKDTTKVANGEKEELPQSDIINFFNLGENRVVLVASYEAVDDNTCEVRKFCVEVIMPKGDAESVLQNWSADYNELTAEELDTINRLIGFIENHGKLNHCHDVEVTFMDIADYYDDK